MFRTFSSDRKNRARAPGPTWEPVTGGSWLCYYKALQDGPASVVAPIDKLSILVTILFSYLVFHEKLTKKSAIGLVLVVGGTLLMLV